MPIDYEGLRKDQRFQQKSVAEKQEVIRQLQEADQRQQAEYAQSQGVYAKIPGASSKVERGFEPPVQPPRRTEDPVTEFNKAFYGMINWGMKSPTFAEQYLPPGFATSALSGVERGGRMVLGGLGAVPAGAGAVFEQAQEQAPRLVGEPARSTPISRVGADVPGLVMGTPGVRQVPDVPTPPVAGPIRAAAVARVNKVLGVTPESQLLAQTGREFGVPVSVAEARQSPMYAKLESQVERLPIGSKKMVEFREGQRGATAGATARIGEAIEPRPVGALEAGTEIQDVAKQAVRTAEQAEAQRVTWQKLEDAARAEEQAKSVVAKIGEPTTTGDVKTVTQSTLRAGEQRARAEGGAKFKRAEDLAGDQPTVLLSEAAKESSDILQQERGLAALAKPQLTRAAGATELISGVDIPAALASLPRELIEQLGLDRPTPVTYRQARALESRLGGLISSATDDNVARQLRNLRDAVRKDLDTFAETAPGDLGVVARDARDFWRDRVAKPFGRDSDIRRLVNEKEPAEIERIIFDPKAAVRTSEIKAEMDRVDPKAWPRVQRHFGETLMQRAYDPATGVFDEGKFATALAQYPRESLLAILGDKEGDIAKLLERFQASAREPGAIPNKILARAIFRNYAKDELGQEAIIADLGKRKPNEVQAVKDMLTPEQWKGVGKAFWMDVVREKSFSPTTTQWSRARFLTELSRHNPETLRMLVGDEVADDLVKFRRLLAAQEKVRPMGDNPSGTASALQTAGQIGQVAMIGGSLAMGRYGQALKNGVIILTPLMFGKLVTSKRGIKLLTEGLEAPVGSKAAQDTALRIGVYLSSQIKPGENLNEPEAR
jgi:hypothetical protein